jgi:hypothetical protein
VDAIQYVYSPSKKAKIDAQQDKEHGHNNAKEYAREMDCFGKESMMGSESLLFAFRCSEEGDICRSFQHKGEFAQVAGDG